MICRASALCLNFKKDTICVITKEGREVHKMVWRGNKGEKKKERKKIKEKESEFSGFATQWKTG